MESCQARMIEGGKDKGAEGTCTEMVTIGHVKLDKESREEAWGDGQWKDLIKKINGLEVTKSLNNFWRGNSKRSVNWRKRDDVKVGVCGKLKTMPSEVKQLLVKIKYTRPSIYTDHPLHVSFFTQKKTT